MGVLMCGIHAGQKYARIHLHLPFNCRDLEHHST
jgi:hypothetical protein